MNKRCVDPECNRKFVISKINWRFRKQIAPAPCDKGLCDKCLIDVIHITYDQSYFGSIAEWGV